MKELQIIQGKLKAPKGQYNSFGKYSYRSCEDILEALKPLLTETKTALTISDEISQVGDRYYVKATVTLTGESGSISTTAYAREEETKKGMDGSQITGSASSYARKYALNGLFAIDDTKDSDSTNTHDRGQPQAAPQAQEPASDKISQPQAKRMFAMSGGDAELVKQVVNRYGYDKSADILKKDYKAICEEIAKLMEEPSGE